MEQNKRKQVFQLLRKTFESNASYFPVISVTIAILQRIEKLTLEGIWQME